jgi:uncharacterized membrane protein
MKRTHLIQEIALRLLMLLGLGVSVLLLKEYLAPVPMMCGEGGGCEQVRASSFAHLLGLPTPIFGVFFFGVGSLLCLWREALRWLFVWALFGALAAVSFIGLQFFVVEAICKYCMVADTSALLAFTLVLLRRSPPNFSLPSLGLTTAGALLATFVALTWGEPNETSAPEEIAASTIPAPLASEQKPGKITIIEFLELGCNACQERDETLRSLLEQYDTTKLNIVRKIVPKESQLAQARSLCCAAQLGFGEQMSAELFSSPGLSSLELEGVAARLGIDPISYRDCIDNLGNDLVTRNVEDAKSLGVNQLPSIWVNAEKLQDNFTPDDLRGCLERAFSAL